MREWRTTPALDAHETLRREQKIWPVQATCARGCRAMAASMGSRMAPRNPTLGPTWRSPEQDRALACAEGLFPLWRKQQRF